MPVRQHRNRGASLAFFFLAVLSLDVLLSYLISVGMGKSMVVVSDFASYCHVNRLSCKDYYKKSDAMLSNSQ